MGSRDTGIAKAVCPICNDYIPKRVTYLYEESLNSWLCVDLVGTINMTPR